MTSSFAPFDISYAARTPYITATEYNQSPTAMDVANLIPGGSAQANAQALQETIGRASSWVDQYTCGAWGTLCATQNAENARIWGNRAGQLIIHPKYWPILSVDAFSYGFMGQGSIATSASVIPSGNIWIEPQQFVVQPTGTVGLNSLSWTSGVTTSPYFCQWLYVNGWPNTTLAASVAAGATSIQLLNATGIYPNTMLTLYDLPYDEAIQVSPNYVVGSTTISFANPLQYAHQATATVTNLPPAIKQAAILATTAFIKQRGSGALVVADMGAVTHQQTGFSQNAGGDWEQAQCLLNPFKQHYVGY